MQVCSSAQISQFSHSVMNDKNENLIPYNQFFNGSLKNQVKIFHTLKENIKKRKQIIEQNKYLNQIGNSKRSIEIRCTYKQ